ncbi:MULTISPECIES: aminotransferase class V-fold PLP-dependent enzyme [Actinomadura]|uniref:Aminotransferase class V-fold PLP-dependent enzyme n=1 Tax=Actinomadura yumaensis TaxID=111807 RepID=A0ABW2CLQ0_9ACTN|nr:aminotransferase class V-fold PLP-dependent enzyme [Actinomadura sp. J1-007]MWK36468.1 aminotransferase class V-fold PLP-dependent enzyme [Actinomadura sp. J1-007]
MDAARFRALFPSLADTVHLASCSQGAASEQMVSAMQEFQWSLRSEGAPWGTWMGKVDEARRAFAAHIGASPDEIAIVSCASEGAFQVASTLDWARRPGIVTTDMEFPSVAHVWLAQRGAEVRHVKDRDGIVRADDYAALIDGTAGLVSVPLVSYRNGVRLPVGEVVEAAHAAGARVFVDAYQAAGVAPIDVKALGCDYLVTGALKYLLGVPGIAFLYVREGVRDARPPQLTGWFGRTDPFSFDPRSLDFPEHARRFETGTPAIPAAYAAVAGMRTLAGADPAAIDAHVRELTAVAHERLAEAGYAIASPADPALRGPQVAIKVDDPDGLAAALAGRRVVTSPRGDLLRLSFHYYNDVSDVDALLGALRDLRG